MKNNHRRPACVLAILVAAAALEIGTSQARADFGWGFGSFNYVPQPGDYLNQHSFIRAANAPRGPMSNNVYSNNPNAYFNRIRDNGFVPRSDIQSRMSPGLVTERRTPPSMSQTSANPPAPAPAAVARPVVLIGSFFNAARVLVWPGDAPVGDGLQAKRDISDQACLAVSDMVDKHKSAPITMVTETRQKLLNYGQPALEVLRSRTTPRVSEAFHLFLLSLYEALAQAANPIDAGAGSKPAP